MKKENKNIEFKAYIKDKNLILDVMQINFETQSIVTTNNQCFMMNNIILLQYTGIEDENQNKIFEG